MVGDELELIPLALGVPLHRFRDAYEHVLPRAMQLESGELSQMNVDVPLAAVTVRGAVPDLQRLRPLAAQLPFVDLKLYDEVETYALALTQAHAHWLAKSRPPKPSRALTEQVKEARLALMPDVQAAIRRGLLHASLLDALQGSNGAKNAIMDVLILSTAIRNAWADLSGKTLITLDEVARAEELADKLMSALADRSTQADLVSQAADVRRRIYGLFFRAYDEARRVVSFLRWREGDAERLAPSLYAGRRTKAGKQRGEPSGIEVAADEAEMTEPTPSPVDT